MPTPQLTQSEAPSAANEPGRQLVHAVAPVPAWEVPTAHEAQTDAPANGATDPAVQLAHEAGLAAPVEAEAVPAAQLTQAVAPEPAW